MSKEKLNDKKMEREILCRLSCEDELIVFVGALMAFGIRTQVHVLWWVDFCKWIDVLFG
jgi:hypothetical protein